jgi:hypothetical protein
MRRKEIDADTVLAWAVMIELIVGLLTILA